MLLSARTTYKVGKIAQTVRPKLKRKLRREETLSRQTVNVIAREIDASFKQQSMKVKLRAQLTSNVFEMIKSPAPGWLASFAFAGLYLGSVLSAIVFAAVLFVGRQANFAQLMNVAATAPTTPYRQGSTQVVAGPKATPATKPLTIVAECTSAQQANDLFAELKGKIPAAGTFRVFGQTLMLELPANDDHSRKEWSAKLEGRAKSVVVESEEFSVPVAVICIAADAQTAEEIEVEFNDYAMGHQFKSLISPWNAQPKLSAEQKQARKTLRLLQDRKSALAAGDNPLTDFFRKRREALRRGDKEAVAKIDADRKAILKKQRDEHIQSVRNKADVDKKLIDIYLRQPTAAAANADDEMDDDDESPTPPVQGKRAKAYEAWRNDMAARLGQLPPAGAKAGSPVDPYGCKTGHASRAGLIVRFDYVLFNRPVTGVPTFVEWLYSQKCVDVKYRMGMDDLFPRKIQ
jgi:hypothetical protein